MKGWGLAILLFLGIAIGTHQEHRSFSRAGFSIAFSAIGATVPNGTGSGATPGIPGGFPLSVPQLTPSPLYLLGIGYPVLAPPRYPNPGLLGAGVSSSQIFSRTNSSGQLLV